MKKIFLQLLLITSLLYIFNCKAQTAEKIAEAQFVIKKHWKVFTYLPPTREQKIIIDSLERKNREFLEKCRKESIGCIDDSPFQEEYFRDKKGRGGFLQVIEAMLKIPPNAKLGENIILITVGRNNSIDRIKFLKYTDIYTRKSIESLFKLPDLNQWKYATNYRLPIETQFKIKISVKKKEY
ncbi:hypothetical protein [Chryseobacterium daeguense]|uniref:hypothetical protein n=1 Tax=Chryseobacterium daeguense TaxID=412438 RepID=UPI000407713F|nr:hypothetical protein [Chryseobacterium daeguense]